MSLGQILRTAREAKGITASELAAKTHLLVQIVEGLENEDFRRIPAPIYGRGFIKLYCEAVDIDPKPLQAEFMTLYNGGGNTPEKAASKSASEKNKPKNTCSNETEPVKVESAEPESQPPPPPTPLDEPPPVQELLISVPQSEPEPMAGNQPAEEPVANTDKGDLPPPIDDALPRVTDAPPPRRFYGELFEQAYKEEEQEKPSAAAKFRDTMSNVSHGVFANVRKLPPNTGRIAMVCIIAIFIVALMGWGISKLYKATTPQVECETNANITNSKPESTISSKPTEKQANPTDTGKAKPKSTKPEELKASGIDVPSLYID